MVRISILGIAAVLATAPAASAQQADDAQVRARQRISMMEGMLERAVKIGADNLLRQMRAVTDAPMLTGVPEVRGFRLDGYGIFFDVEVPMLRLPVTWPLRYMFQRQPRSRDHGRRAQADDRRRWTRDISRSSRRSSGGSNHEPRRRVRSRFVLRRGRGQPGGGDPRRSIPVCCSTTLPKGIRVR